MTPLGDDPRFLARRSELGYTSRASLAVVGEPEAVSADEQRELTAQRRRAAHEAQVAEWQEHRASLQRSIDWLHSQRFRRDVRSSLRALERQVEQLDDKIHGRFPKPPQLRGRLPLR